MSEYQPQEVQIVMAEQIQNLTDTATVVQNLMKAQMQDKNEFESMPMEYLEEEEQTNQVIDMEGLTAEEFFNLQPATQRFLCFKMASEALTEMREIKQMLEEKKDQEIKELREVAFLMKQQLDISNQRLTHLTGASTSEDPRSHAATPRRSAVELFEDSIKKNREKFKRDMAEKKTKRIWPTVDDALSSFFTKAHFRRFYSKSRVKEGKLTLKQSVFCNIVKEIYPEDAEERMLHWLFCGASSGKLAILKAEPDELLNE